MSPIPVGTLCLISVQVPWTEYELTYDGALCTVTGPLGCDPFFLGGGWFHPVKLSDGRAANVGRRCLTPIAPPETKVDVPNVDELVPA